MPDITHHETLPGVVDPATVTATVELWGDGEPVTGYLPATDESIGGKRVVRGNPWTITDLVSNADPDLLPAGTVYRAHRTWPGLRTPLVDYVSMPTTGGPYSLGDILADEPGTIESSALALHKTGTGFGIHVPVAGSEGQVLLANDGAAEWASARIEALEHQPGVNRWRVKLAKSRSGGGGALSVVILCIGDSRVRASSTLYRNAWIDRLLRRFLGATPAGYGYLPASGNLGGVLNADWPGGDNPWTFTGAVTGNVNYGPSFHAANIPTAGTATITYFGDKIDLLYVRTADGPTAAAVTLDGVAQTALNARGAVLPGQRSSYGTNANYGFHTLVVTPNDGPLIIEGAQWYDNEVPFFIVGTVQLIDASHVGFQAAQWAGVNNDWSAMFAGADAFYGMGIMVLGANDIGAGRTPAQFRDDVVTIVGRVDARLGTTDMSWLFCWLPGSQATPTLPYVEAMRDAAVTLGTSRARVFDLAALRPGRLWGTDLSADESHPNDAGNVWVAEQLGTVLDPTPTTVAPVTARRTVIDSSTPTDGRLSWTEAWTALTGIGGYDQSGVGTTVGERRHRVWLDPGTYRATVTMQEDTGLATVEVLIGRWVGNTPTLTSCGTKANAAGTPTLVTTRFGSSVTTEIAGWHPVVIRKTSASGAIRFVHLTLDKTA